MILDLCGGSGAWGAPFAARGYPVQNVDILHGLDVRTYTPPAGTVWGVVAAPPCTVFARSGNRYWYTRPQSEIDYGIAVARACLALIHEVRPTWWALENPIGRLGALVPELGQCAWTFQPYEYMDFYSKRTCIWGNVAKPPPTAPDVKFAESISYPIFANIARTNRTKRNSITPSGFAEAFCEQVHRQFGAPVHASLQEAVA